MSFKYHKYIDNLPDCPPSNACAKELEAFRFVFDDISDERNFSPAYIRKPGRKNVKEVPAKTCSGYGLSMFETLEKACGKYMELVEMYPNFPQTAGTHIAKGQISKFDGVTTEPNDDGHLTLYEYDNTNLYLKFSIIYKVYNDGRY